MELLFGTFNEHKADEIRQLLGSNFTLRTCRDFPSLAEVEETEETLQGNALLKARAYHLATGLPCFADDTGLEVTALGGAPGVYSARYSGHGATYETNNQKLLDNLGDERDRSARFRTVIALVLQGGKNHMFEGILPGRITYFPTGTGGFGYDPIFLPGTSSKTLAEMTLDEKNAISHRGLAVAKLVDFLMRQ